MRKWNFYTPTELSPSGWLKKQLEIQAKGLSGNLDKMWPDIRDSAWIGGKCEGWERVPYWLDGFIPLAYLLDDKDMIARAKKYIDAIISAQKEDGWICPCKNEDRSTYDTWAVQLITKVLTVYYDCSKDERIPGVIYNVLKNYYELLRNEQIALFNWGKFRWFECLIAINFTYERYKENWLKELAQLLKQQGADYNDFIPLWKRPLNRWRFDTHIVNLTMMLKAEAIGCDLLSQKYTDNAEKLYSVLKEYNGTAVETFTGDECLSGLSAIQGTELCSVTEQMYSYEQLFAYSGDSKWVERLEILAFNALPATISDDMWTHQYVQMVNQIACERFPGKPLFRTNSEEAHLFGLEPNFGCCTANFNQGWPKFALSAFMHNGNEVLNALMIPSELKDGGRYIKLETDYPFKNTMKYTVVADEDFTFRIRIPSFAENLTVNGETKNASELTFDFRAGDSAEIILSFETVAALKDRPYGLKSVQCGSLVFAVPVAYEKKMLEYEKDGVERKYPYCDYEFLPTSDWNYAYSDLNFDVERKDIGEIPFSSENPPITIKAFVTQIGWGLEDGYENVCAKIPESLTPVSQEKEIELFPYGCAKLRMTELPLIE